MTLIGNIVPALINIQAIRGDTIDLTFYVNYLDSESGRIFYASPYAVPSSGVGYNLTALKIHVLRKDNLLIKEWISGVSPSDIVISGASFHLSDLVGFEESGALDYEVQDTSIHGTITIIRGQFWVLKEFTT